MQAQRTKPQALPKLQHVSWWLERTREGVLWIHFRCAACGDESMKRCENYRERGAHWIATYATTHVHR